VCVCAQRSACWRGGVEWPASGRRRTAASSRSAPTTSPICSTDSRSFDARWSRWRRSGCRRSATRARRWLARGRTSTTTCGPWATSSGAWRAPRRARPPTTRRPLSTVADRRSTWRAVAVGRAVDVNAAATGPTSARFPALRFRSSVSVSPCSVSKIRKNYAHP